MKTDNIYITEACISTRAFKHWSLYSTNDIRLRYTTTYRPLEKVLILYKKNIFGKPIAKDLNTGKKYKCKIPTKIGVIFVNTKSFDSFNSITLNTEKDLPKNKIKEIGNKKLY